MFLFAKISLSCTLLFTGLVWNKNYLSSHRFPQSLLRSVFTKMSFHVCPHVIMLLLTLMRLLAFREFAEFSRDQVHYTVYKIMCLSAEKEGKELTETDGRDNSPPSPRLSLSPLLISFIQLISYIAGILWLFNPEKLRVSEEVEMQPHGWGHVCRVHGSKCLRFLHVRCSSMLFYTQDILCCDSHVISGGIVAFWLSCTILTALGPDMSCCARAHTLENMYSACSHAPIHTLYQV